MGGMQCIKYTMFFFNFLFWVCSTTHTLPELLLGTLLILSEGENNELKCETKVEMIQV